MATAKAYTPEDREPTPAPGPHKLVGIQHILTEDYPPLQWVIPDLMPEGLTMLFSAPKVGKSIVALYISLRMALKKGTVGGHVIYLSLDDRSERRMQTRLRDLLQGTEMNESIDFVFQSEKIGKGLVEQLAMDLEARPDTKLIVIDVYAKVKPEGGNDIFKSDYDALEPLRTFAEQHHIAILLIHHSRKRKDADDWLNEINGSTGLSAAVDTIWKLDRKRGGYDMRLFTTGRDAEDAVLNLDINDLGAAWVADAEVEENEDKGSVEPKLMNALLSFSPERPARNDLLATVTGLKLSTVKVTMRRLLRQGKVVQPSRGGYHLPENEKLQKLHVQNDNVTFVTLDDDPPPVVDINTRRKPVGPHPMGRECAGKCWTRIAPEPDAPCGCCGRPKTWRIVSHAGAALYICQKCHPSWREWQDEDDEQDTSRENANTEPSPQAGAHETDGAEDRSALGEQSGGDLRQRGDHQEAASMETTPLFASAEGGES